MSFFSDKIGLQQQVIRQEQQSNTGTSSEIAQQPLTSIEQRIEDFEKRMNYKCKGFDSRTAGYIRREVAAGVSDEEVAGLVANPSTNQPLQITETVQPRLTSVEQRVADFAKRLNYKLKGLSAEQQELFDAKFYNSVRMRR